MSFLSSQIIHVLSRLNLKSSDAQRARLHYINHFGAVNRKISVANHSLVLLDAPGLVEEDYLRAQESLEYNEWTPIEPGTVKFVKSLKVRNRGQYWHSFGLSAFYSLYAIATRRALYIVFSHASLEV